MAKKMGLEQLDVPNQKKQTKTPKVNKTPKT